MSMFTIQLIMGIAAFGAGIMLLVWLRKKFKNGLPTRIYIFVMPAIFVAGMSGYQAGDLPEAYRLPLLLGAFSVDLILLYFLYRRLSASLNPETTGLFAASSEIAGTARQTAATANEQAATAAEVATTVAEITQTSAAASKSAQDMMSSASEALEKGRRGVEAIEEVSGILDLISQVGDIVELVNDIADQSNLLAVNAGIEAAKAGEHGRGFSVVATEVRRLAEQSKQNAQRIRTVIQKSEQGKRAIETARIAVQDLSAVLDENVDRARQIAATATQQTAGISQISEAMTSVAEGGRQTASASKQLEESAAGLQNSAMRIKEYVLGR